MKMLTCLRHRASAKRRLTEALMIDAGSFSSARGLRVHPIAQEISSATKYDWKSTSCVPSPLTFALFLVLFHLYPALTPPFIASFLLPQTFPLLKGKNNYKPENNSKVSLEMTGGFSASSQMLNSQLVSAGFGSSTVFITGSPTVSTSGASSSSSTASSTSTGGSPAARPAPWMPEAALNTDCVGHLHRRSTKSSISAVAMSIPIKMSCLATGFKDWKLPPPSSSVLPVFSSTCIPQK
ncbi:hypothetical protein EK904_002682, partial [Melospiza melodia maxima]